MRYFPKRISTGLANLISISAFPPSSWAKQVVCKYHYKICMSSQNLVPKDFYCLNIFCSCLYFNIQLKEMLVLSKEKIIFWKNGMLGVFLRKNAPIVTFIFSKNIFYSLNQYFLIIFPRLQFHKLQKLISIILKQTVLAYSTIGSYKSKVIDILQYSIFKVQLFLYFINSKSI